MAEFTLAFVFPAFASEYSDHPGGKIQGFSTHFSGLLDLAASNFEPALKGFDFDNCNFLDDELFTQYITYIYSCAASNTLKVLGIIPDITAGYSMGIYAALFNSGSIDFIDGLKLIRFAYESIQKYTLTKNYSMATIIGLDEKDICKIIDDAGGNLEITNQNSPYAFVISGDEAQVKVALDSAREEGAIHIRQLNVGQPYHANFLQDAARDLGNELSKMKVKPPAIPIISVIDTTILNTEARLRSELINNIFHHLNWYQTIQSMLDMGVETFVECGPSKGLVKNARFVDGNFRFLALDAWLP